MKKYTTFIMYRFARPNIYVNGTESELKILRKIVYDPTNVKTLKAITDLNDGKTYKVFKDDKLLISVIFILDKDDEPELDIYNNKKHLFELFKCIYSITFSHEYNQKFIRILPDKEMLICLKEHAKINETYIRSYFHANYDDFHKIIPNYPKVIFNNIHWKEENLIWLKVQIETQEFIITEQGHLTVVNGIAYGSMQTIINWRNILPRNSWKLISDEPIPVRTTTRVVQVESVYDAEYMRNYYHVRKVDKYKMKIKIQSEATKLGMSYGEYRRQYYPNFTFRDDDKVKFSVIRTPQQYQQQSIEPKVEDLLIAYLTVPI